jgi:hypothetical protein
MEDMRARGIEALLRLAPDRVLLIQQADWHLRGLLYHLRRIRALYEPAIQNVADMAAGDSAGNILVTTAPEMPQLVFELYAFMNLARVTLDQLIRFAGPALTLHSQQRPNSITDVLKWETTFPVFVDLTTKHRPLLQYLVDIRDCIVHDRTFASSEGVTAVEEGFPEDRMPDMPPMWSRGVVRTYFRRLGGKKVSVNILLPDAIYNYNESGVRTSMIRNFSYGSVNVLSQCRAFAQLCTATVLATLNDVVGDAKYDLDKPIRKKG